MKSIWSEFNNIKRCEKLQENIKTEVAVIGAGIAGILIAYKLQNLGKKVIILEANRIASGQTQNTTAKITSQHGLIYEMLIKKFGEERARQYSDINNQAVEEYKKLIYKRSIDCDFEEQDSYVYTLHDEGKMYSETEAAKKLGIDAYFTKDTGLPFNVAGAVKFPKQAQFNPIKFIENIAESLIIYEDTPVRAVNKDIIVTDKAEVQAQKIVFASHYPIINFPGMYFTRMHQSRSYVLALKNTEPVNGMYISADGDGTSFRNYRDYLLFGGGSHRTGENETGDEYNKLRQKAKSLYPNSIEERHWSAQDCMTIDGIPYIGKYSAKRPNWYVATGFNKWGMTSAMVSAIVISDAVCEKNNICSQIFDPGRFMVSDIKGLINEGKAAVKGIGKENFKAPVKLLKDLEVGNGDIIEIENEKFGVYKESEERIYAVSIKCPHLGCQLEWNADEKSWDCPCHGSRFDYTGKLIDNPAQNCLKMYKV